MGYGIIKLVIVICWECFCVRKFNGAMIFIWVLMGILVVTALVGGIAYDWQWIQKNDAPHDISAVVKDTLSGTPYVPPSGFVIHRHEVFPAEEIDNFVLDVVMEEVIVRHSNNNSIMISQYGSENLSDNRMVQISRSGSTLRVKSKKNNRLFDHRWNQDSSLVILLPASYSDKVDFSIGTGELTIIDSWAFSGLKMSVSMGDLKCQSDLSADVVDIEANMGEIRLAGIDCTKYDVEVSMGDIHIESLSGSGKVNSNAGSIYINRLLIKDSSALDAAMGSIVACLANNQSFEFDGSANMGDIKTYFNAETKGNEIMNHKLSAKVGDGPYVELKAETSAGSIEIREAQ